MRWSAALAALLLPLWGSAAYPVAPAETEPSDPAMVAQAGDVAMSADAISYDWQARRWTFTGNVRAARGEGWLRADHGNYDAAKGFVTLTGNIFGVQGREVFVADEAVVDVNARAASLKAATLFLKDHGVPIPADAAHARAGKNALTLKARTVRRLDSGAIEAGSVSMTPCDCAGDPDYELQSPTVTIEGDRARLEHPALRILGATLPLPVALSLPLTDRQSGLLFPPLVYSSTTGFGPEVPIFLTLGRSYDATLAPGFYTGTGGGGSPVLGRRSVVGPRLTAEFRYAPIEGTGGSVDADLVKDLRAKDSPGGRGFGGLRGILRFDHRTGSDGFFAAAKGTLASDVTIVSDIEPISQLDRYLDALRTDVGAVRTAGPLSTGIDATFLQDVRIANGALPDRRLFGAEARSTLQRLPAVFAQVAPVRVGPVAVGMEASVARFAPVKALDPEERATGFGPTDLGAAGAPAIGDAGRDRVTRIDVSPRAFWGTDAWPVRLAADAGARADAWFFDSAPERNRRRAYASGGVRASSELERGYGRFLHSIEPALEVRGIAPAASGGRGVPIGDPFDAGGPAFASNPAAAQQGIARGLPLRSDGSPGDGVPAARRPYDEIDGAAPETGEALARASLSQALWVSGGSARAPARIASFDLSQDLVLWDGAGRSRIGEAGASLQLALPRFAVGTRVQLDWGLRAVTQLAAGARLSDARGDELHGGLNMLRGIAGERLRAGIDELFGAARLAARPGDLFGGPGFGGSVGFPLAGQSLRAGYDASHYLGQLPAGIASWTHLFGLSYDTPCRCAGLQLSAAFFSGGTGVGHGPIIHFTLDLKSLGSFATF